MCGIISHATISLADAMCTGQEETWSTDPNAFVADEDDEAEAYSLRSTSHDLLGVRIDDWTWSSRY